MATVNRNNLKQTPIPVVPRTMKIVNPDGTVTRSGQLLLEQLQVAVADAAAGGDATGAGPQLHIRTVDINDTTVRDNCAPNLTVQASGKGIKMTGVLRQPITADLVVVVNVADLPLGTLTIPAATPVKTEVEVSIATKDLVIGTPITFDITASDGSKDKDGIATVTVKWGVALEQVTVTGQWKGTWAPGGIYLKGDSVSWMGSSWISLQDDNTGNAPDISPDWWDLLALKGDAGADGLGSPSYISALFTGPDTSRTITGATHAYATAALIVMVYDNASPRNAIEAGWTVNASTYDVVVTFAAPQSNYYVVINGAVGQKGATGATGATGPAGSVTNTGGALTADQPVFGAGAADTKVGTKTGNTNKVVTNTGTIVTGNTVKWDAGGNLIDAGTTPGGSGTVTAVTGTAPIVSSGGATPDISIATMTGDSGSGGARGAVPAPGSGDASAGKFLKADATWSVPAGGGGGGLVLLEQHTASGSSTLNFTSCITSTYDEYEIHIVGLQVSSSGAVIGIRMSSNAGSSYDSGGNYQTASVYGTAGGSSGGYQTNTTYIHTGSGNDATGNYPLNGTLTLYGPASSAYKSIVGALSTRNAADSAGPTLMTISAVWKSSASANAFQFVVNTGTFSGTVRVYGVAK